MRGAGRGRTCCGLAPHVLVGHAQIHSGRRDVAVTGGVLPDMDAAAVVVSASLTRENLEGDILDTVSVKNSPSWRRTFASKRIAALKRAWRQGAATHGRVDVFADKR